MNPIVINLNNLRSDDIYVLLTDINTTASTTNVTGITINTVTPISAITNNQIIVSNVNGGRLYFCKGVFTGVPLPNQAGQYYAWIEFSQMPSDCPMTHGSVCQYWVNLSNVDITGMQLALTGTDINSNIFSVGYKESANDIISALAAKFPLSVVGNGITAKILAPNHLPSAYPSYSTYFNSLIITGAGVEIISDDSIHFKGKFCNYNDPLLSTYTKSNVVVLLTDTNGNTIKLTAEDLTDNIIYQCDGGNIYYNNIQWPQNRGDSGPTVVTTNSTFREIMLGFNEGYWTPSKTISNCNFAMMVPFTQGGNQYAEMIHNMSNSYGFPYADSNLKVLLTALAGTATPLMVTICNDNTPTGYTDTKSTNNMPSCGDITLGVGPNNLGVIAIGECTYSQQLGQVYGGYLPQIPNWTKMYFNYGDNGSNPTGKPTYIYVSSDINEITGTTGGIINADCKGHPIINSINGPIGWLMAATGYYCLTLPEASLLTGNGPCINPIRPINWFKKLMVKIIEYLVSWNRWTK